MPNDAPAMGDNLKGTLLTGDALAQYLNAEYSAILAKSKELLEAEARMPKDAKGNPLVTTEQWERDFTDHVNKIQECAKRLESHRVAEKAPYDTAAGVVHNLFKAQIDLLNPEKGRGDGLRQRLDRALTVYKLEKKRIEDEKREADARAARAIEEKARAEADRLAREAQEAEEAAARKRNAEIRETAQVEAAGKREEATQAGFVAAAAADTRHKAEEQAGAKAADLTRARGAHAVSSLREFLNNRDIDRARLDIEALRPYLDISDLQKAVNGYQRANGDRIKEEIANGRQPLRGATFFLDHSTTVRR